MQIKIKGLTHTFQDKKLFNNLDTEINNQDFVVIFGESGSGKTTLLNLLSGLLKPERGNITILDNNGQTLDMYKRAFRRDYLNYVFQNFGLIDNETVAKNLELPLLADSISKKDAQDRIVSALEAVGLSSKLQNTVSELSGGEQQRVALSRILLKKGDLILADEPTGNLDAKNRKVVIDFLLELQSKGKTIIVVTHDATFFEYATKIIYL